MKKLKFMKIFAMMLVLSMVSTFVLPVNNAIVAQAATVKISDDSLLLQVGKSETLKVTGTKNKVTWTSSKKSVATVNKSGKVTAKKEGTATITATVNKKKYTCKVTVFKGQKQTYNTINYVIPKTWTSNVLYEQDPNAIIMMYPSSVDQTSNFSNINLTIYRTGNKKLEGKAAKDFFDTNVSEELLNEQLSSVLGEDIKLNNYTTGKCDSKLGTVYTASFSYKYQNNDITQTAYFFHADNYAFQITATDFGEKNKDFNLYDLAESIINSFNVTEEE